jgi:hypothetical protein
MMLLTGNLTMYSDPQFHARRPRACAVDVRHEREGILTTVLYVIASSIIVLWLAYLSSVTGDVLSKLHVVPEHVSYNETVNRVHKTGRLTMASFDDKWKALSTSGRPDAAQRTGRIPDGCETAFGGLIKKAGNFASRCVT